LELLCSPLWGSLSDRVGRKPILLLGLLGYGLSALLFGLSTQLWMLFASRALSGLLSSATSSTALAYISDSTSERDRGGGLGMLGAAMGLGLILGPAAGGWLGGHSLSLPFYVAAGASLLALLLAALWLPESLPAAKRRAAETQQAATRLRTFDLGALWKALRGPIAVPMLLLFVVSFGLASFESVFGLYAAQRLGYGPERVGTVLAVVGLASTLGKALLIGPLTRRWGESPIIKASLAASALGFGVLTLATTYPGVLAATGVFILAKTLLRTVIIALASKRGNLGQGATMGLSNSFMNLGRIVGPIWAGYLFDLNAGYPYLSGAAVMLVGFVISLLWIRPLPKSIEGGASAVSAR
jgi:DHA1 family multidrug resistance protein-like MFS transporter